MRIQGISGQPHLLPEGPSYVTTVGDTLRVIATKFNFDPEALRAANNLKQSIDEELEVGRELRFPEERAEPIPLPFSFGIAEAKDVYEPPEERAKSIEEAVELKPEMPSDSIPKEELSAEPPFHIESPRKKDRE
jgi:LysM repeat protein